MRRFASLVLVLAAIGATGCFATVDEKGVYGRYFTPAQALEFERVRAIERPNGGQLADCHGADCRSTAVNGQYGYGGYGIVPYGPGAYGGMPVSSVYPDQAAINAAYAPPVILPPQTQVIVSQAADPRVDGLVQDVADVKTDVRAMIKAHLPPAKKKADDAK